MKKRTAIASAAGAILLGAGAFGIATAQTPQPSEPGATSPPTTTQDAGPGFDQESMIRHCTDALPADQRDEARQQMQDMMGSDMMGDGMMPNETMSGPMMGTTSGGSDHHGMR